VKEGIGEFVGVKVYVGVGVVAGDGELEGDRVIGGVIVKATPLVDPISVGDTGTVGLNVGATVEMVEVAEANQP